jgi:hypothetical protein
VTVSTALRCLESSRPMAVRKLYRERESEIPHERVFVMARISGCNNPVDGI